MTTAGTRRPGGGAAPGTRTRGDSSERLLQAAVELFAERGYDRTTLRDVGERAGVDAALVARHFGGKAGLYLAALRAETGSAPPDDVLQPARRQHLLDRARARGAGPVWQAALRPHDHAEVQQAASRELRARLVDPLVARFEALGLDRASLRAEIAVAALAGVVTGRGAGALSALAEAGTEELVELTGALLDGLLGAAAGRSQAHAPRDRA